MHRYTINGIAFACAFLVIVLFFRSLLPQTLKEANEEARARNASMVAEEPVVELYGTIASNATYSAIVSYTTTSESFFCTDFDIGAIIPGFGSRGFRSPEYEDFSYEAKIEGDQHHIIVPINEKPRFGYCGWEATTMKLCLATQSNKRQCIRLFSAEAQGVADYQRKTADDKVVNVVCDPFDIYTTPVNYGACYTPIDFNKTFSRRNYELWDRYQLAPQKVQINFKFVSVAQAKQRIKQIENIKYR